MHRFFGLIFICLILFVGCSDEPTATMKIQGQVYFRANGQWLRDPVDSAKVILTSSSGKEYIQNTSLDGGWAFKDLPVDDYTVYALRPRFGRCRSKSIKATDPFASDSIFLRLAAEPLSKPAIDSVVGSSASGYTVFISPTGGGSIGLLIRNQGEADSSFRVWATRTDIAFDTARNQYIVSTPANDDLSGKEIAAVVYDSFVDTYGGVYYDLRFCSQGPLSNIVRF
jgi:hypothetical protein